MTWNIVVSMHSKHSNVLSPSSQDKVSKTKTVSCSEIESEIRYRNTKSILTIIIILQCQQTQDPVLTILYKWSCLAFRQTLFWLFIGLSHMKLYLEWVHFNRSPKKFFHCILVFIYKYISYIWCLLYCINQIICFKSIFIR